MATKTAEAEDQEQPQTEAPDGPVLDMSDAAVKKLIKTAKTRGFVTYDELNEVLPSEEVSSEQIEDTMSMLSDMGINVIDTDEAEESSEEGGAEATPRQVATVMPIAKAETKAEPSERTDDPVRMYLREIGRVPLLSAAEEVSLAKRMERGKIERQKLLALQNFRCIYDGEEAQRRLTEANLRLVVSVAKKYIGCFFC